MTVGLAFSGGDMVAVLGSMCSTSWLGNNFPEVLNHGTETIASTVSGGSIGWGLMANAGNKIFIPDYDPEISFETVNGHIKGEGETWFGASAFIYPRGDAKQKGRRRAEGLGADAWRAGIEAQYLMYGVRPDEIHAGGIEWYDNFASVAKLAAPLHCDRQTGIMKSNPRGKLEMGWREMRSQTVNPSSADISPIDSIAWSSSFWAMDRIFEDSWKFLWDAVLLPQSSNHGHFGRGHYFSDGGNVDVSGITTLLHRQVDNVIAFFNAAGDVREKVWSIRTLFGQDTGRNGFHSTNAGGAKWTQVFPSSLGDEVAANLTNPKIMRAILHNVPVMGNAWLKIKPYTLKTLVIFSSMYNEEFVDSFTDPKIKQNLGEGWPTGFVFGTPPLDANMFCMLQEWKMDKYKDELATAIHA